MPLYYFHIHNGDRIRDTDGTELPDHDSARAHANGVARELMEHSEGILGDEWSNWRMIVHDEDGDEVASFGFSEVKDASNGDGGAR